MKNSSLKPKTLAIYPSLEKEHKKIIDQYRKKILKSLMYNINLFSKKNNIPISRVHRVIGKTESFVDTTIKGTNNPTISVIVEVALAIGKKPILIFEDIENE